MTYLTTSQKNSLVTDTPEGEAARRAFFSSSSHEGGWYEDFRDHLKDQPLDIAKEDRILSAVESTIYDIGESAYIHEGLIDPAYGYSVKDHTSRQGIADWAYYTAREVVRGLYSSVSEIEDEVDANAASDAERTRELGYLASQQEGL